MVAIVRDTFAELLVEYTRDSMKLNAIKELEPDMDSLVYSLGATIMLWIKTNGVGSEFISIPSIFMLLSIKHPSTAGKMLEGLLRDKAVDTLVNDLTDAINDAYKRLAS